MPLPPPKGYLKELREICTKNNVLLAFDEIQTGFGRTGKLFCYQHEDVVPDLLIVGKALSGGLYPVSAVLANRDIMEIAFEPGSHGSTFGANPMACAIASAAIDVLIDEDLVSNSEVMGTYFKDALLKLDTDIITEVRGKGLMLAIELNKDAGLARVYTEALMKKGLLAKETHEYTIRFAPPLIITKDELDWAISKIKEVF